MCVYITHTVCVWDAEKGEKRAKGSGGHFDVFIFNDPDDG